MPFFLRNIFLYIIQKKLSNITFISLFRTTFNYRGPWLIIINWKYRHICIEVNRKHLQYKTPAFTVSDPDSIFEKSSDPESVSGLKTRIRINKYREIKWFILSGWIRIRFLVECRNWIRFRSWSLIWIQNWSYCCLTAEGCVIQEHLRDYKAILTWKCLYLHLPSIPHLNFSYCMYNIYIFIWVVVCNFSDWNGFWIHLN